MGKHTGLLASQDFAVGITLVTVGGHCKYQGRATAETIVVDQCEITTCKIDEFDRRVGVRPFRSSSL